MNEITLESLAARLTAVEREVAALLAANERRLKGLPADDETAPTVIVVAEGADTGEKTRSHGIG